MGVAECGCVFQAVAERAIEADMRGPNQSERNRKGRAGKRAEGEERKRADCRMGRIVRGRAGGRAGEVSKE